MKRLLRRLAASSVLLICVGCSASGNAEVTGVVKVGKNPLSSGSITIIGSDGKASHGAIGENGQYSVRGLSYGTAKIGIVGHPRVPKGLGGAPAPAEKSTATIPLRYTDPSTSDLTVEVNAARVEKNIDLKPD